MGQLTTVSTYSKTWCATRQDKDENLNQAVPEPAEPDQEAKDKVDDIMRQPICMKNMDEKTTVMTGILDGKLPWPKEIETQVVKDGEDYNATRLESLRLASQKMQDMVLNFEDAQKEINLNQKKNKTRAGRRSRAKNCKGNSPKSRKRKVLKNAKVAGKTQKGATKRRRRTSVMKKEAEETPEIAMPEVAMPEPEGFGEGEQPEVPPPAREGDDGGESNHADDGDKGRLDDKDLAKKLHSVPWQRNCFWENLRSNCHPYIQQSIYPTGLQPVSTIHPFCSNQSSVLQGVLCRMEQSKEAGQWWPNIAWDGSRCARWVTWLQNPVWAYVLVQALFVQLGLQYKSLFAIHRDDTWGGSQPTGTWTTLLRKGIFD